MGIPLAAARGRVGQGRQSRAEVRAAGEPRRARSAVGLPPPQRWQRLAGLRHPWTSTAIPTVARSRTGSGPGSPARAGASSSAATPAGRSARRWSSSVTTPVGPGASCRPPAEVLLPAEGEAPAEALAGEQGRARSPSPPSTSPAASGFSSRRRNARSPRRSSTTTGGWSREAIELPPALSGDFHLRAIDATGLGNAWAIAETDDPALNRSVVLLQRTSTPGGPLWVERTLAGTPFREADPRVTESPARRRSPAPPSR